jgi:ferric-dicitrate binding protein FerR (iron transport regulator)
MEYIEKQDNYTDLIVSCISGNASADEIEILKHWINKSPENKNYYEEIEAAWLSSSQIVAPGEFNNLKAYQNITSEIKRNTENNKISNNTEIFTLNKLLKIAALMLLMVSIGGISSYFITKNIYNKQIAGTFFYEAPIGSRAIATLPDGTKIWLNAGSKLEYNSDYNVQKREVTLIGEGYFKVKTDPSKPFLVKTHHLTIKATGTRFNVKAYPSEKLVTTTLEEGKVELKGKDSENKTFSYQMKPKQKVVYFNDNKLFADIQNISKKQKTEIKINDKNEKIELPLQEKVPLVTNPDVRTELYTSWKDERWIIESEKLSDLAVLFERRYNVTIVFNNSEVKNYRFSATIQNETIEQIFDIMRFTLPISYEAEKGIIKLNTDKRLKNMYRSAYKKE